MKSLCLQNGGWKWLLWPEKCAFIVGGVYDALGPSLCHCPRTLCAEPTRCALFVCISVVLSWFCVNNSLAAWPTFGCCAALCCGRLHSSTTACRTCRPANRLDYQPNKASEPSWHQHLIEGFLETRGRVVLLNGPLSLSYGGLQACMWSGTWVIPMGAWGVSACCEQLHCKCACVLVTCLSCDAFTCHL